MSLDVQFWTLAMMLLSGIGMGVAFDGYRVLSNRLRIGRLWIPVLDMLYWLAATIIVFRVLSASNEGEVRVYVFLGLLLGIGCYFWLFSSTVIAIVVWLIETIQKIVRLLIRCFDWLVLKPIVLLYRFVRIILGFFVVFTIFLFKIVIQLLRPFYLLLGWAARPLTGLVRRFLGPHWTRLRVSERIRRVWDGLTGLWKKLF
ncbi:spore cortex biosynthesis protein YabQ [Paenibacillus tarimensis]